MMFSYRSGLWIHLHHTFQEMKFRGCSPVWVYALPNWIIYFMFTAHHWFSYLSKMGKENRYFLPDLIDMSIKTAALQAVALQNHRITVVVLGAVWLDFRREVIFISHLPLTDIYGDLHACNRSDMSRIILSLLSDWLNLKSRITSI